MDEVLKQIMARRSVRDFQKRSIPDVVIQKLVDAIIWAPSAGNLRSRKFYFISDLRAKRRLAGAALNQDFIEREPTVVVGCADNRIKCRYGERGTALYALQDVACSIMNMMLVASENGLRSVWVGAFREGDVFEILGLPEHLRPVVLVPVGYPSRIPSPPPRALTKEVVESR